MDPADALRTAQDFGLELPTPAYIAGVLLFSVIGIAAWIHGKRAQRPGERWTGLALMLYPYVVPGTVAVWLVGLGLTGAAWWFARE